MKALGKHAIEFSALMQGLKKAINSLNPALGIAAGVALIALGEIFEKSMPKLATGGIVTRPTNALIGESGPEAIIPLGKVPGMFNNNGSMDGTVVFKISGNELRGILNRANKSSALIG